MMNAMLIVILRPCTKTEASSKRACRSSSGGMKHATLMLSAAMLMQAFFIRWWTEQDERMQRLVRRLVRDKQLGFVNGGYVQNDEAASHYIAMIDQTTRGHRSGFQVA
jgi:Glycosyl hydrolases family 38 N-terminal domain